MLFLVLSLAIIAGYALGWRLGLQQKREFIYAATQAAAEQLAPEPDTTTTPPTPHSATDSAPESEPSDHAPARAGAEREKGVDGTTVAPDGAAEAANQPVSTVSAEELESIKHELAQNMGAYGSELGFEPDEIRLSESALYRAQHLGMTEDQLRSAVANSTSWIREGDSFRYKAEGFDFIVDIDRTVVLKVFPADKHSATTAQSKANRVQRKVVRKQRKKRLKAGPSQRGPLPSTPKEMKKLLESRGFVVALGKKHYSVTHPDQRGKRMTMPCTPEDVRWSENFRSQMRMVFGIDLRDVN
ncbi:hypothetical protein P4N68_13120 [Corynebacterium felinum]|uniref:RNA binding protein YcfA (HicA-like mRNA interferase family) n=1 Tax=Corynebacterium felinum TaxID=131318 RepID=A0ABU2B992_9CORY|nr:hypothetical protein [Corynebacterium felinum]MDF5822010.1 hypothetical protein [Corynebacterium felinum]MDR7355180.1 putative RNA binding protein YcfA (HicA-like mRNA interferase family) [Corynebacterium felinum]WJY94531.1 hypothetical protein CFELI_04505 [Corynebacterium felinum]